MPAFSTSRPYRSVAPLTVHRRTRSGRAVLAALLFVVVALLPAMSAAQGASSNISLTALSVSTLVVDPEAVPGGTTATATVTLTSPAPAGGTLVTPSTSNPSIATTPSSLTVPEGQTSATFPIQTTRVNQNSFTKVYAEAGGVSRSASLYVLAPVAGLSFSPHSVVGGTSVTGTVVLAEPAPAGGALVVLDNANPTVLHTPDAVLVPEGQQSATFGAATFPVSMGSGARVAAGYAGGVAWASMYVTPPSLSMLSLQPAVVTGGASATGIVTLDGPAPENGVVVALDSTVDAVATVPTAVTIPVGASSATFPITTGNVMQTTLATLTATAGQVTRSATLTVTPVALIGLSVSPDTVTGGTSTTGTVTLNGPAPAGGIAVSLSSSAPKAAKVPASVIVPAGATSATFTVTTARVSKTISPVIGGTYNGIGANATLTVLKGR